MEQYQSKIYKSRDSQHLLHNLYRKHMIALRVPVRERMIETPSGDTHVVFYGNPNGIPVLTFYGESFINPLAIRPFTTLLDLEKIQLIVPDPPGRIGFSDEERQLSFSKKEYGLWAFQVMDGLGLETTSVLGYSFGGYIALQLCAIAPLRIERLVLALPGGIITPSSSKLTKLIKPASSKDEKSITDDLVRKTLKPILSFQQDELIEAFRMIYLHTLIDKNKLDNIKKKDLHKFRSPVYLITEKTDELFPGEEVQKRARKIIPRLEATHILRSGCHCGLFDLENKAIREAFVAVNNFLIS